MPVFRSGREQVPAWCELEYFDIISLKPGETHSFRRVGKKEKLIVGTGKCRITSTGTSVSAETRTNIDLITEDGHLKVHEVVQDTILIRMCGRWGNETGGSGLFSVMKNQTQKDTGDSVDYPKETRFDNHYHDCDEYWIIFEGCGVAVSEGISYQVGPGDCIATGKGHHHDFPQVQEDMTAVYFETTIEGEKRRGHLWNHTHGPAEPEQNRI